jgi:hypothetical protein
MGASRNRILEIVYAQKIRPVLQIMLSADETVYQAHELRRFCEAVKGRKGVEQV